MTVVCPPDGVLFAMVLLGVYMNSPTDTRQSPDDFS